MATTTASMLDLPLELLLLIFRYLDVNSFLKLTATCKALRQPHILHEPSYWSSLVRTTFRVPNQLVVEKDGARWLKLYRRMLTQTRVYTWGNNDKGCLGHPVGNREEIRFRAHAPWPQTMQGDLGVISDLQCGGWSTTLLTSRGALYTIGVIDGMAGQRVMAAGGNQQHARDRTPLLYPPGFPPPVDRYAPSTAIKQFSAGRAHVLALSDSGRIWSWHDANQIAFHVKFLHHDLAENGQSEGRGVVKKVVAGWSKSAALIDGTGIVLWDPLQRDNDDTSIADAALVMDSVQVPNTNFSSASRSSGSKRASSKSDSTNAVGEVSNFVILEHAVLFCTELGKVFVSVIDWDSSEQRLSQPRQMILPQAEHDEIPLVTDVQGSFRSYAVFTKSGAVLTGSQDALLRNGGELAPGLARIPALQHSDVIQVAFGDHHFHALHAPGYITSYGTEPQHCGALGLGSCGGEGRLRGLRYHGAGDARLVPHANTHGRRVWFEAEKRAWLDFVISGGVDPAEAMERVRMALGSLDEQCHGEVSEWIEQEGRYWEERLGIGGADEDGLGAYFALSVAAAGWHSGALVTVDDALVKQMTAACEVPDEPESRGDTSSNAYGAVQSNDASSHATSGGPTPAFLPWLLGTVSTTLWDYGRWFLGLPEEATTNDQASSPRRKSKHGTSPRPGSHYIWANDSFPRLVLRDGTEMPGMVPFDDWRYGRPEWNL